MKISRIYLDKSVIGGCHDEEFATWSNGLMKDFRLKNYHPVLSQLTFDEISKAPQLVQEALTVLLDYEPEFIEITKEALLLSEVYLKRKILTPNFRDDALHIAMASLSTWMFWLVGVFTILFIMTRFVCLMPLTLKMA